MNPLYIELEHFPAQTIIEPVGRSKLVVIDGKEYPVTQIGSVYYIFYYGILYEMQYIPEGAFCQAIFDSLESAVRHFLKNKEA